MKNAMSNHENILLKIPLNYLHHGIVAALIIMMMTSISDSYAAPPSGGHGLRNQKDLGDSIYIAGNPEKDKDNDFLIDEFENQLAWHFKPYLIFDSKEGHTQSFEPVTLVQVRPVGCVGLGCGTIVSVK